MRVDAAVIRDPVTGLIDFDESYYYVAVGTSWLERNWKPTLDRNNAIVMWSICYSADDSMGTSVKEAAGGRWRSGYVEPVNMYEAIHANRELLGHMNGSIANGKFRTTGSAYNDSGVDYHTYRNVILIGITPTWVTSTNGTVRMDGDYWTTLCPAPIEITPTYPVSSVTEKRKGFGCVLLDTTLNNTPLATEALIKESGGAFITETYLLKDTEDNFYGVGFTFDKTLDNSPTTMKAVSDKIRNQGTEGRQMDGDRVQPNTDDKQWSF
jgi:hypothetical protein